MAGGEPGATKELVQETARATRIRVDSAANSAAAGNSRTKKSAPPERAA
jgi:hypothetical protein